MDATWSFLSFRQEPQLQHTYLSSEVINFTSSNQSWQLLFSQEPYLWDLVTKVSKAALNIRYSLLPYYYTLLYKANRPSSLSSQPAATVLRPLFFEFPQDAATYDMDWAFMVGSALLISPVLRVGKRINQVVYLIYAAFTGSTEAPKVRTLSAIKHYLAIPSKTKSNLLAILMRHQNSSTNEDGIGNAVFIRKEAKLARNTHRYAFSMRNFTSFNSKLFAHVIMT